MDLKSNQELNSNALKLRKIFNEDANSPIDIFAMVNNLKGFTLVCYPMSERISGMCIREKKSNIIAINSKLSYGRQRYTIAHELYHLFFEEELKSVVCEINLIEKSKPDSEEEADIFASYLLVPYDALHQYLDENGILEKKVWAIEDIIRMEQFFQLSHQAMLYRLVYDNYISWETYHSLKPGVKAKAIRMGYSDRLYNATEEDKMYFSLGEYIEKVERLREHNLISEGKYDELLLEAFREDIVYNLGSEGISIYD